MSSDRPTRDHLSRRTALAGVAGVGLGVPLLAGCGAGSDDGDAAASAKPKSGTVLGATGDVEVGGGEVFTDAKVVVTQPSAGDFKCFTAVCTHSGCLVSKVTSDGISCPCHGSLFSAEDGSVLSGPAPSALDAVAVTVAGDQITLA